MSVEIVPLIYDATNAIVVGILLLGMFRATEIRRVFVNPVYRNRATWSGFFMLILLIQVLSSFISFPSSGVLSAIGFIPTVALLLAFFAYADRSVLVAVETDFFHRNTLSWTRGRRPAVVVVVAGAVGATILSSVTNSTAAIPLWEDVVGYLWEVAVAGVLAYSAAALIVGARRSSDRTLRRSILLLGLALITLVISIVVTSFLVAGTVPYAIVYQGTAVVGIYLIYRSVTSLSPVSRIEKAVAATSKPGESGVISPSHP